jgi:tetratricopeptide (TPR) repeat protein
MGRSELDLVTPPIQPEILNAYFLDDFFYRVAENRLSCLKDELQAGPLLEDVLVDALSICERVYRLQADELVLAYQDALYHYLDLGGYWDIAQALNTWAQAVAQRQGDHNLRARLMHDQADLLNQRGFYGQAVPIYFESQKIFAAIGNTLSELKSMHQRSMALRALGKRQEASELNTHVIEQAQDLDYADWLGHPLYTRALLERDQRRFTEAESTIRAALENFRTTNNSIMEAHCLHFLGELYLILSHDPETILQLLNTSLTISEQHKIIRRVAATERLIGDVKRVYGDHQSALLHYEAAEKICEQTGDLIQLTRINLSLARIKVAQSDRETAENLFLKTRQLYRDMDDPRGQAVCNFYLLFLYLRSLKPYQMIQAGFSLLILAIQNRWFNPIRLLRLLHDLHML